MTGSADPASLAEAWIAKAAGDLAAAKTLLQASVPQWTAAFHAQQCVEKCLKAVLVALDRPFPMSHDIRGLVLLLPADLELVIDRRIAAELSESAVKSAIDQPPSFTANDSGRSRLPWQTLQSVADIYCVTHSRYLSEPDSSKFLSRNFRMPGKRKPFSPLDFFLAGLFSPAPSRPFEGG